MTTVDEVRQAARRLPPAEQLQLIQELLHGLQHSYALPAAALPADVRRTPPVSSLDDLAADFWPEDESADAINAFVAQQRAADRGSDQ